MQYMYVNSYDIKCMHTCHMMIYIPISMIHGVQHIVLRNKTEFRGGSRTFTAGGTSGFTEARSTERVGVTPSRRWGSGGPPPEIFEKLHQNGAFWVYFEVINTRFLHWKWIWKKCVSLNLHIDYSYFFFKILRNLHQNGAFWAHIN